MRNTKLKLIFSLFLGLIIFTYTNSFAQTKQDIRIVSLGGTITETIFALGGGKMAVGVDVSSIYPTEAEKLPKVGYWRRLSPEGVISLKPTHVIATYDAGPEAVLQQFEKAGIKVIKLPAVFSFNQVKENINTIANAIGKIDESKKVIAKLEADYKKVVPKIKSLKKKPKTLFLYLRNGKILDAGGKNTPADGMINIAGGTNVASELEGWKTVTSEFFLTAQPDVLILTKTGLESAGGAEALKNIPGLGATPAVKNNNILILDDVAFLGFGPRFVESLEQTLVGFEKVK